MPLSFRPTSIAGVILIGADVLSDERGTFTKCVETSKFGKEGLTLDFAEEYYSFSNAGVLRGMHFQLPPLDHEKFVYCASGRVLDVVLDLRQQSLSFKKCFSVELSAENGLALYIPKGCAHGFFALDDSIMIYKAGTPYSPEHDSGIRWDSFGFEWPVRLPIISKRDSMHLVLDEFWSPF